MNLSYWEIKTWLSNIDFTIVGSGIVGLSCALQLREKFPKANILVLEKGTLPQGASTKNAGFACFGSLSEILDDLNSHSEDQVVDLVHKRLNGLALLKSSLGNKTIAYKQLGGYELFTETDSELFEDCVSKINYVNQLLKPIFKKDVFGLKKNVFQFKKIKENYIFNPFEGQIDTGKMMEALLQKALSKNIKILNNIKVKHYTEALNSVTIETNQFKFSTSKLLIATNGFASQLDIPTVKPARAQVLITKPIKNLHIKGTFHLDRGYYYFRNIDNRILFGGGRNLDFKTEETTELGQTSLIQNKLEELLKTTILPGIDFEIDYKWSGIMGVGTSKQPVVKQLSNHVYCGVRLGGMGVAIGSLVGKELAELV
ncbi:FAD-binding oxidoreductase [Oceanihabitans sediminis]|uniref:FAD-binding oxidoreductase n=1 Tax=Oceanihabitans sediminis TaxID=1812012 RepID=A0A368P7L9_9FLAO|nr:FAD-dependent oxidoreductase [Oceanihabitans sediminis]MDX1277341.1 FAD-dependent oxidoreductase [Oceanihabitans sediminis]MDX1773049.1 FAD-dependent oxidoreductase [Oceanihabitans sediminis]RBP34742.1 glycine/D-amino acid oxidase-like deaminating enzyme [Oceanihabitans sediminis]RCU58393.1 FAD-binding oxidoreductase [Oceanihabitans sediminis]